MRYSEAQENSGDFAVQAAGLRKTHDASALLSYMEKNFEPVDGIEPSKVASPDNYIRDFPADLDGRIAAMELRLEHEEAGFQRDVSRYESIRADGLNALDELDIMFFGGGDPVMAVRGPLMLLRNHIASYKVTLPRYRELLAQWKHERAAAGEQLGLEF